MQEEFFHNYKNLYVCVYIYIHIYNNFIERHNLVWEKESITVRNTSSEDKLPGSVSTSPKREIICFMCLDVIIYNREKITVHISQGCFEYLMS